MSGYAAQEPNTEMVTLLSAFFPERNEPNFSLANIYSTYINLPGLVAFWTGNSTGASARLLEETKNNLHLTNNNTSLFGNSTDDLVSYVSFNGSNQYFNRTTEAVLQITGTESRMESSVRGLTLGCWVRFDNAPSAAEALLMKFDTTNNSYYIQRRAAGGIQFAVYNTNAATLVNSSGTTSATTWYFIVGRFTPSTEMKVWINEDTTINTTSIPASIDADTADFTIGATGAPASYLDGRMKLPFLCASALSDAHITNLYQQSRGLFGV